MQRPPCAFGTCSHDDSKSNCTGKVSTMHIPRENRKVARCDGETDFLGVNSSFMQYPAKSSTFGSLCENDSLCSGMEIVRLVKSKQSHEALISYSKISYYGSSCQSVSYQPVEMTEVLSKKLYIGSEDNAWNKYELLGKGITHVLSVSGNANPIEGVVHEH